MSERICKHCGGSLPTTHGNRRYCSENCRKRKWDREDGRGICEVCGSATWKKADRCPEHSLVREVAEAKRRRVAELWEAGLTMREIAEAMGWTMNHLKGEFGRMRAGGWSLPHRYKTYAGRPL